MLLKKLVVSAATGVLLLGALAPMAFADVEIDNSNANVSVSSTTQANSGLNGAVATEEGSVDGLDITTGAAVASNVVGTQTNTVTVSAPNCGCEEGGVSVDNSGAEVQIEATTQANSGLNGAVATDGGTVEDVSVTSGAATAGSNVQTVTNTVSVTVTPSET